MALCKGEEDRKNGNIIWDLCALLVMDVVILVEGEDFQQ